MSNQTSRVPNPYETPLSLAELLGCAAEVLQHLHESNKRLQDHIGSALSESDFGLIEDLQILDSHGQIAFDLANCLKRLSQASANGVLPKKNHAARGLCARRNTKRRAARQSDASQQYTGGSPRRHLVLATASCVDLVHPKVCHSEKPDEVSAFPPPTRHGAPGGPKQSRSTVSKEFDVFRCWHLDGNEVRGPIDEPLPRLSEKWKELDAPGAGSAGALPLADNALTRQIVSRKGCVS